MVDWSNIEEHARISDEDLARLESPSGKKCPCGKETNVGEDEAWGACYLCYNGNPMDPQKGRRNKMEIVVTVFLDIDDKVADKRNPDLMALSPERRQVIVEQGTQSIVEIALKKHFEESEGVTVSFVKADTVHQS